LAEDCRIVSTRLVIAVLLLMVEVECNFGTSP